MFYLNVAVLTVFNEATLDNFITKLYDAVSGLIEFKNSLVTIRKQVISNTAETNAILNSWKDENLIFFFGAQANKFQNSLSEEQKTTIENECPTLRDLLFKKHSMSLESCFLSGGSLVYQILSDAGYEEPIKSQLPFLFEAAFELRNLKEYYDLKISTAPCGFLHKSSVPPVNVTKRPRASPFSMVSVEEALKCVLKETRRLGKIERRLKSALNYILAECIYAPEPYPPFDASMKDGYAVIDSDPVFNESLPAILSVVGNSEMGHVPRFEVVTGTCARVSTGGMIPALATAVVQVEDTKIHKCCEGEELSIAFSKKPKLLQDIRVKGSDISEGSILVQAGQRISSSEIGLLSIFGIRNVVVFEKPWVAIMSTGDEVSEPEDPLHPGCIRDSNKSTLCAMLRENHIPFVDVGIAKDNADAVKSHLYLALCSADIIISTGGVSMGEKDIMKEVLKTDFGAVVHFGRVHMKPGKPTTFSTVEFGGCKKMVFSLPGNPVSACVCFFLFVMPCIKKMMGYLDPQHKTVKVKLRENLKLDERPEFCRATLSQGSDGVFDAVKTGDQQSSRLLSMQNADALLILPAKSKGKQMLEAGSLVNALILNSYK